MTDDVFKVRMVRVLPGHDNVLPPNQPVQEEDDPETLVLHQLMLPLCHAMAEEPDSSGGEGQHPEGNTSRGAGEEQHPEDKTSRGAGEEPWQDRRTATAIASTQCGGS